MLPPYYNPDPVNFKHTLYSDANIGNLGLSEILDIPAVQSLMDDFYKLARIPMSLIDLKGKVLVGVGWQDVCLHYHRVHPETCRHCIESDIQLSADIPPGEYKLYKCKNNMWDVATPVIIAGCHVGSVFSGQFFFDDEPLDLDFFRAQARQYGFDEDAYLSALQRVPRLSRQAVRTGMEFLVKLAGVLSRLCLTNLNLARSMAERDALMASLRHNESRLRVTLNSIGDAVLTCDAAGAITFLNPVAEQLTGWAAAEAASQPIQNIFNIINEQTGAPADDIVARVLREGHAVGLANHTALIDRSGRHIPIEDSAAPILDDSGAVTGVVLVFYDVTHKRRAEEELFQSREDLKHAQAVAQTGSWRLDVRRNELLWSDETHRMFGIPRGVPLSYESFLAAIHPEDRAHVDRSWQDALRGGSYDIEHRIVVGNDVKWVRERAELEFAPDGTLLGGFGTVQDITERKHLEKELRRRAEDLADADRRKDEFLAMLAHELRNPLAPIRNAAQILKMIGDGNRSIEKNREIIERQASHMGRLLDDLLDVSRITRGKIQLRRERVDLRTVVAHAVEVAAHVTQGRPLDFHYQPPPEPVWLSGDFTRLEQIVGNLLSNAVKYTDRGDIRIELLREPTRAVIRVHDTGIGIDADMLPRVFDLFAQADQSLERTRGGLGIGLTMVKRLVELHGGRVHAASPGPGRGSVFTIFLPLNHLPAPGEASLSSNPTAPIEEVPVKVLIVDDSRDAADSLRDLLEIWGYNARAVYDGPEAVQTALAFLPEIILLDIGLPIMSGYAVARRLREEPSLESVKIIALTGYGQEEDRKMTSDSGCDEHLVKPVDLKKLQSLLSRMTVKV